VTLSVGSTTPKEADDDDDDSDDYDKHCSAVDVIAKEAVVATELGLNHWAENYHRYTCHLHIDTHSLLSLD